MALSSTYALQVRKSDLALLTLVNNGLTPKVEKAETYLIFELDKNGELVNPPEILRKRDMLKKYDIAGFSPLLMRLKLEK